MGVRIQAIGSTFNIGQAAGSAGSNGSLAGALGFQRFVGWGLELLHSFVTGIVARDKQYLINNNVPHVLPDPNMILKAHFAGLLSWPSSIKLLRDHGIDAPADFDKPQGYYQQVWAKVLRSSVPTFDVDAIRRLRLTDEIDESTYLEWMHRAGMPTEQMVDLHREVLVPRLAPGLYVSAWLRDERSVAGERFLNESLIHAGVINGPDQTLLKEMAREIPGLPAQFAYATWNLDTPSVIERWGLAREKPDWWDARMVTLGLDRDLRTNAQIAGGGIAKTDGQAIWETHWRTPTIDDALNWSYRFRGDPGDPSTWSVPGVRPFTPADVNEVVSFNAVAPGARQWEVEGRRPLLSIRHIRMLLDFGIVDRSWVVSWGRSIGYSQDSAEKLADANVESTLARHLDPLKTETRGTILKGYAEGWLSRDNAAGLLYPLTLRRPSDVVAFRAKNPDDQNRIGLASSEVSTALRQVDLEAKAESLKLWVKSIRELYTRGQIDLATAQQLLRTLGMVEGRIPDIIDRWNAARFGAEKEISSGEARTLVLSGIITVQEYQSRLLGMGYSIPDIIRLTASLEQAVGVQLAKQAAALAKTAAQKQKAAEALVRAQRAALRQAVSDLARHGSPGQLVKWAEDDIIAEKDFRKRMAMLQWPDDDIGHLWAEIQKRKDAKQAKLQPKPAKPVKPPKEVTPGRAAFLKWYTLGIIDAANLRSRLRDEGYTDEDIDKWITEVEITLAAKAARAGRPKAGAKKPIGPKVTKAELFGQYRDGVLDEVGLRDGLAALGYNSSEVENYIAEENAKLGIAPAAAGQTAGP